MHLTPKQIRTACRAHLVAAGLDGEGASDDLLAEMCRRLSLVPDVRWSKVEDARSRLLAIGAPTAEILAEMLLDELRSGAAR